MRWLIKTRKRKIFLTLSLLFIGSAIFFSVACSMPGKSFKGPLPSITTHQQSLAKFLERDVRIFAEQIGERNHQKPKAYKKAADFITAQFKQHGFKTLHNEFLVNNQKAINIIGVKQGSTKKDEILIIGAHYDSVAGQVGANDNASGVAALLAIARGLKHHQPKRTIRLVAFANEEPPYYHTNQMGSVVYAAQCKVDKDNIVGMISLDGIGYYTSKKKSQKYPFPLSAIYPSTGNFLAFVSNISSRKLLYASIRSFRKHAKFPSEGAVLPGQLPAAGMSDHWSFWKYDYPAILLTDTLPFRYHHYHTTDDTPDKLSYDHTARVVEALTKMTIDLANADKIK